jgi:hypothetical protein
VTPLAVPVLDAARAAPIAVLAWVAADGTPRSCAVTPYVDAGDLVVTSTLAFPAKAAAMRRDPRVAMLVGGHLVTGRAEVAVADVAWFDRHVRAQEAAKFPPSRSLFAIPGHRRLFPWYVQRIVVRIGDASATTAPGDDTVTLTSITDAGPAVTPVPRPADLDADTIDLPGVADGPVDLLVHEEHADYADLRQRNVRGIVRDGLLEVATTSGSLAAGPTGTLAQLRELRRLGALAKASRPRWADWPRISG